jgi:hypothetical protein
MAEAPAAIINNLVIISLPKSGTTFVLRAVQETLRCVEIDFSDASGKTLPETGINLKKFEEFIKSERSFGGHHISSLPENLEILERYGVTKIVLLLRDPRATLISWWHHLERPDVKMSTAQQEVRSYDSMSANEKLAFLIDTRFDRFQKWRSTGSLLL